MKTIKNLLLFTFFAGLFFSCSSSQNSNTFTIVRGTGDVLGSVTATASVNEHRRTGETSGDTQKYGFLLNQNEKNTQVQRLAANSLTDATKTAYANAMYEIIQQARKMGGNALNEVTFSAKKDFDMETQIETVTVTIIAEVIKTN